MEEKNPQIKKIIVGSILTNCYFVYSQGEAVIIDPGAEEEDILSLIAKKVIELKYIINTHCHPDHIMGNDFVKKNIGGKILIHKAEKFFIDFRPDRFLEDGDLINVGEITLKVLHTPGHTKGSICLLSDDIIFSGDTLFKDGIGRVDLIGGSQQQMEDSLGKLKKFLRPKIIVYPGHGESFQIEKTGLDFKTLKDF